MLLAVLCCAPACSSVTHNADGLDDMYDAGKLRQPAQDRDERGASRRDSGGAYEGSTARADDGGLASASKGRVASDLYGSSDTRAGRASGIAEQRAPAQDDLYDRRARGSGKGASEVVSRGRRDSELYGSAGAPGDRYPRPAEKGAEAKGTLYEGGGRGKEPGRAEPDQSRMIAQEREESDLYGVSQTSSRRAAREEASGLRGGRKTAQPAGPPAAAAGRESETAGPPSASAAGTTPSSVPEQAAVSTHAPSASIPAAVAGEKRMMPAAAAAAAAGPVAAGRDQSLPTQGRSAAAAAKPEKEAPGFPDQRREAEDIVELNKKRRLPDKEILVVNRPPNIQGLTGLLFTNSAYTLPAGKVAVGASLLAEYSSRPEFSVIQIPMTLTYGVTDRIEAGLKAKIVDLDSPSYLQRAHGFGDSEVSVKWRFASQRFILPDMAVGLGYILPTGNESKHLNEVVNWGLKFMGIASWEGRTAAGRVLGVYAESQAVFIDELTKSGSSTRGAERYGVINGGVLFPVSEDNRLQLIAEYNQILYKERYRPTMIEGNQNAGTAAVRYVTKQFSTTAGLQYINKEKSTDQNTYRFVWKLSLTF